MATTEFIAAIELGSSKITGVAGRKNSDGSMQVLAYAQEDSSTFIRKGVIFNLDKTAQSLTSIINRLEGELKNSIAKVYVGIGGQSLRTVRNVVSRDLEEEAIISEELVSAIGDENIAIPVVDMDILDVAPQEYKVGNNLQANPVGLVGSHIEGRFLNIVARASVRKNLEHCFQQAKIDIADQLIAPLVTANAVLTESERRSGCALIDFGADTTTISVYKNNILRFLTVLPLGGNSITRDITTLQMEEEEAERLKKAYGDALYEEDPEQEEATCKLDDDNRIIKVADLNNIIEARAEEIVANVWNQIQLSGYEDKLLAGLILTGGAANLKNLDETLRKRSKIEKIRMAKLPRNTVHAPNNILKKDVITLHTNATEENHHLLDAAAFAKMKPGVTIVNTARGKLIDSDALLAALESSQVGAAGLDVLENENGLYYYNRMGDVIPNPELAAFRAMPNVILTDHTAFYTYEDVKSMVRGVLESAAAFAEGSPTRHEVTNR